MKMRTGKKALALCRVSTLEQRLEGHSLERQEGNVLTAAEEMGLQISQLWSLDTSSKAGVNIKRKDLKEIYEMCVQDKQISYLLIDETDRFMRSIEEFFYYEGKLKFELGVKTYYVSQPGINEDTTMAKVQKVFSVLQSEMSNNERKNKSMNGMKARIAQGYYPFPVKQGYIKSGNADGLHQPDGERFILLQTALKAVASAEMTIKQAQVWLWEQGYRTPNGGKKLDMYHFTTIVKDPYYAGIIKVSQYPVNENGLHQPMITKLEYEINFEIASGRKVRQKAKHNPKFPLNLAFHEECVLKNGKLSGVNHSNGKGWSRDQYMCRICNKGIPRDVVHDNFSNTLDNLVEEESSVDEFKDALRRVWRKNEAYRIEQAKQLKGHIAKLEKRKSDQITSLAIHPEFAEEIKTEILRLRDEIKELEKQGHELESIDEQFEDFMFYSIDYTEGLRTKWWEISPERKNECRQLLFNDEIYVESDGSVYTPKVSLIYRLMNAKSDPKVAQNARLVELPGIAPGSEK